MKWIWAYGISGIIALLYANLIWPYLLRFWDYGGWLMLLLVSIFVFCSVMVIKEVSKP
jgi:hypothetical protein